MAQKKPVVYILHGDDEFALAKFVAEMESKMGDPTTADMNTTRLEGHNLNLDELVRATRSMPFLTERRLVIVRDPFGGLRSKKARDKFKEILEQTPPTTALVILNNKPLVDPRKRRSGQTHWIEKWAADQGSRVFAREHLLPRGPQMARWIQTYAKECGGEFTFEAASLLGSLVNDDPRLAAQEIDKLLAYANYRRSVEIDDVELLVAYSGQASIFEMVDALGNRNGRQAQSVLHKLLEEDEPLSLFGMVVRQFRLLLLTRELLDSGHREGDIARELRTAPFIVRKLMGQARNFNLPQLEAIYRKLLEIDEGIKTGKTEGDVALDTLVAALAG